MTKQDFTIRAEIPADRAAIAHVNELAFGRTEEARLIDELRDAAHPFVSLVAVLDGEVVGHIAYSPVTIERSPPDLLALGLAPMSVLPEHQRRGIGSELIRRGNDACRELGAALIVVVGHPEYYPRFGFRPARPLGLECEYDVPDEVFMAAELVPAGLASVGGLVRYHPAFAGVG